MQTPPKLVSFVEALIAVKAGGKAQRSGWVPANTYLYQGKATDKSTTSLVTSHNTVLGVASLHNNDIMADDWIIMD